MELPVYTIDFLALSHENYRCPEDACGHIVKQAKSTCPSIIYLPKVNEFWDLMTETTKITFLNLLKEIDPSLPILIFATNNDESDVVEELFAIKENRIRLPKISSKMIRLYFSNLIFKEILQKPPTKVSKMSLKPLPPAPTGDPKKLTDKELRMVLKQEESVLRELRLFLRDVINKLSRDRKFNVFTKPVDKEEVPDYYDIIEHPMDLSKMMSKIDREEYKTVKQFLEDIDLICFNALEYNPPLDAQSRSIRHRACALKDTARGILEADLASDFEKMCDDIYEARRQREEGEKKQEKKAIVKDQDVEKDEKQKEKDIEKEKEKKRHSSSPSNKSPGRSSPQRTHNLNSNLVSFEYIPDCIPKPLPGQKIFMKRVRKSRAAKHVLSPFCKPTKIKYVKVFIKTDEAGVEIARYDKHGKEIETTKSNDSCNVEEELIDGIEDESMDREDNFRKEEIDESSRNDMDISEQVSKF